MGYEIFGKVKTIVLPFDGGTYTGKEYFEKYGIDLIQIFHIKNGTALLIRPSYQNALFLMKYSVVSGLNPILISAENVVDHVHSITLTIMGAAENLEVANIVWNDTTSFNLENISIEEL